MAAVDAIVVVSAVVLPVDIFMPPCSSRLSMDITGVIGYRMITLISRIKRPTLTSSHVQNLLAKRIIGPIFEKIPRLSVLCSTK